MIVDALPVMIKYLDGKVELSNDEKEILLFALYAESIKCPDGLASQAKKKLVSAVLRSGI